MNTSERAVSSYQDLVLWQKAMDLVELVYKVTKRFPKEETYGLTDQLRRAAVSIPSNIAEGQERKTAGEFKRFLLIAQGSRAEIETQLQIALRLKYLSHEQTAPLMGLLKEIGKMNNALRSKLG